MTNKMKLLIGLGVLGFVLLIGGTWFLVAPFSQKSESTTITIRIPEGSPVIFEELRYLMGGEKDSLYIYEDGTVIYVEEKGLRIPTPKYPPTRTWKTGKLSSEELNSLLEFVKNNGFEKLNEYYQFSDTPSSDGDGQFTFSIDSVELQKKVITYGYLTTDKRETYPDMPFPLNELYVKLRDIILNLQK